MYKPDRPDPSIKTIKCVLCYQVTNLNRTGRPGSFSMSGAFHAADPGSKPGESRQRQSGKGNQAKAIRESGEGNLLDQPT